LPAVTTKPELTPLAEGVWIARAPVIFVGLRLVSTMTVLRLEDGTLVVHSPVPLTTGLRAAIDALGPVAHLYAPNTYHHLRIGDWAGAFPSARVHAPAQLARKRPDLKIDRWHDRQPEPAFAGTIDECHVEGFRLEETVLFHRRSRTLVLADLVHHAGPSVHWATALYARVMGFYNRVAVSRLIRWAAFSDRGAVRRSLDRILALPFERIVLGHGPPLVAGAREALAGAYGWLPAGATSGAAGPR
jgi:hypothetical protein